MYIYIQKYYNVHIYKNITMYVYTHKQNEKINIIGLP